MPDSFTTYTEDENIIIHTLFSWDIPIGVNLILWKNNNVAAKCWKVNKIKIHRAIPYTYT